MNQKLSVTIKSIKDLAEYLMNIFKKCNEDDIFSQAGQLSFSFLMSITPLYVLMNIFPKYLNHDKEFINSINFLFDNEEFTNLIISWGAQRELILTDNSSVFSSVFAVFVFLLFSLSFVYSFDQSCNKIINNESEFSLFVFLQKRFWFACLSLIPIALLLTLFVSAIASAGFFLDSMGSYFKEYLWLFFSLIRLLLYFVLLLGIFLYYSRTRNRKVSASLLSALITSILLFVWHYIFKNYQNVIFGDFLYYGEFSILFSLLTWVNFSALIIYFGVELNGYLNTFSINDNLYRIETSTLADQIEHNCEICKRICNEKYPPEDYSKGFDKLTYEMYLNNLEKNGLITTKEYKNPTKTPKLIGVIGNEKALRLAILGSSKFNKIIEGEGLSSKLGSDELGKENHPSKLRIFFEKLWK